MELIRYANKLPRICTSEHMRCQYINQETGRRCHELAAYEWHLLDAGEIDVTSHSAMTCRVHTPKREWSNASDAVEEEGHEPGWWGYKKRIKGTGLTPKAEDDKV